MFRGGKPTPMGMWIMQTEMDKEERQKKLDRLVRKVRFALKGFEGSYFNMADLVIECDLGDITQEEIEWVNGQVNR